MTKHAFSLDNLEKPRKTAAKKREPAKATATVKVTPWAKELFKRIEKLRKELDGHKLA